MERPRSKANHGRNLVQHSQRSHAAENNVLLRPLCVRACLQEIPRRGLIPIRDGVVKRLVTVVPRHLQPDATANPDKHESAVSHQERRQGVRIAPAPTRCNLTYIPITARSHSLLPPLRASVPPLSRARVPVCQNRVRQIPVREVTTQAVRGTSGRFSKTDCSADRTL